MTEFEQKLAIHTSLYEHQRKILSENKLQTGLWLGTGSGKTLTALLLACGKTLVICPKTQKEDRNWEREAQKNNIHLDLTVISKESFRTIAHTLPRFDTVIVDEAHTCLGVTPNIRYVKKQPVPKTSQIFEALETFMKRTYPTRLYLITATIIKNPMTVWGAAKLFGKTWDFYNWREAFYTKLPMPGREVFVPKRDSLTKNRLAKVVQSLGYVGRLSDYFDVPDQTYRTMYVELTAEQKRRIRELPLEFPDPLVLIGKRHQVENGVLAGNEFSAPEFFSSEKIEKLQNLAEEFPKMIIFAKYIAQIEQIRGAMSSICKNVFVLTGDTKDRGGLILAANQASEGIFIAQSQISAGWELPDYPVMVFASMSYSVVDRVQGEGRILRANALKKNLYIDLIVKGGIDEAVYKSIQNKQDFNERIYLNL